MEKYPGKLGKPRPLPQKPRFVGSIEERERLFDEELREVLFFTQLLFEHYGLEPGNWCGLALSLAMAHVPAFRRRSPGRPAKWTDFSRVNLAIQLDEIVATRRCSVASAAAILAKRKPWNAQVASSAKPADTLRKQYEKVDRVLLEMTKAAMFKDAKR